MARTVLGRGLSALIPNKTINFEANLQQIEINSINPNPNQPRHFVEDDSFKELVSSVKQFGILQPLVVQEKNGGFEIIAGERRYRAAVNIGIAQLPAVVKKVKDEFESFELALVENIQRQDLSPLEEANAYRYLLDDCGISQEKLAKQLGKSRSHIANTVRLLNLDESVQRLIEQGRLSAGHARALVSLSTEKQKQLGQKIASEGLSVRQVEDLAKVSKPQTTSKKVKTTNANDDFNFLEEQLSSSLSTKVRVKSKNSKGHIEIHFNNYKELSRLKKKLL